MKTNAHSGGLRRFYCNAVLALSLLSTASRLAAAPFPVTTTTDGGPGSLRQAIIDANALPGPDTIMLPAGTYTLSLAGAGEELAATGDLDITDSLTIKGDDAGTTIIDGNGIDRVFDVLAGTTVISGVTIRGGNAPGGNGGGFNIPLGSILTLSNAVVQANTAIFGGGIVNGGTLVMIDVWIEGNVASSQGGGIRISGGGGVTNQIERVTFSGNSSLDGGGILTLAPLNLTNITVSSNRANRGGGIQTQGALTLVNTTLAENFATNLAGGIRLAGAGSATLRNTLLANNTPDNAGSSGSFTSSGHNIDTDGTAGLGDPSDQSGTVPVPLDAMIDVLANYGGPTPTHALLTGSIAIDPPGLTGAPATDQRGEMRDATPDIGAFEVTGGLPPSILNQPVSQTVLAGANITLNVTANGTGPLVYQWDFNGQPLLGATSASLMLNGVTGADAGDYLVRVTNAFGSATSTVARLTFMPMQQWATRYDGPPGLADQVRAMTIDKTGNVYVTGISLGTASGPDAVTVKYNPDGSEAWAARYNGPVSGGDFGQDIAVDGAGSVYITGESRGTNANPDFMTIKYDGNGQELWAARYNSPGNGNDTAYKIAVDFAGNVLVTGDSDNDIATIKYDPNGGELWVKRYNGTGNGSDLARALTVDPAGNVYVGGAGVEPGSARDFTTIKYDPAGNELWASTYSGPFNRQDVVQAIALDSAGNVIVTGPSPGPAADNDFATVKYDSNGNELWVKRFDGPASGSDQAFAIVIDANDNVVVAGSVTSASNGAQFGTLKYDPSGNVLWTQLWGGAGDDVACALALDLSGNVFVAGTTAEGANSDLALIKYDSAGNQLWTTTWDHAGFADQGVGLAVDRAGSILLSGTSFDSAFGDDYVTLMYGEPGLMIALAPQTQTGFQNEAATLTVTLTNTASPRFQWFHDGLPIPDATNASLALVNLQVSDAGNYFVEVTNVLGRIQSPPALLTVLAQQPPVFTEQPQSQDLNPGDTLLLSAEVRGSGTLLFQWRLNGVNIPDATNAVLVINNVSAGDSGSYTVAVENNLGAVESARAIVRVVLDALPMTDLFADQVVVNDPMAAGRATNTTATVEPGEPAHHGKAGGSSLWITWEAPATGIATFTTLGSSFDTLLAVYVGDTLTNLVSIASSDDDGGFLSGRVTFNATQGQRYRVAVDGFGGAVGELVLSWDLEVTVETAPVIVTQPASQVVAPGDPVEFSVTAQGAGLAYAWFLNGSPVQDALSDTLTILNATAADVGAYVVRVSGGARFVDSEPAVLELQDALETQPTRSWDKLLDSILAEPLRLPNLGGAGGSGKGGGLSRGYTGTQVFSTTGAAKQPGEPIHCGVIGGASQWFTMLMDVDGQLRLNTDGSTFDTVLAVYTGTGQTFQSLQSVACDNNSGTNGLTSALMFPVNAGTLYFIAIDGVKGATGRVQLNYRLLTPAQLTALDSLPGVGNRMRVMGQPGGDFQILVSSNLSLWNILFTTNSSSGEFEFLHLNATNSPASIYRTVTLP